MTLADLTRLAQTEGDEYRWLTHEQRKEREEEAKKVAEETRLRGLARLSQHLQKYANCGTQKRDGKAEMVV